MAEHIAVAKISDVAPGTGKVVEMDGKSIALFNVDGKFYAIDNGCPHRGGPLAEGTLEGCVVSCPLHLWDFDVTTGEFTANRDIKVATYSVEVDGPDVKIAL